jgi:hypothetical protein
LFYFHHFENNLFPPPTFTPQTQSPNSNIMTSPQNKLAVFQEKEIRRVWHNGEWWFSISDVVCVLTDSKDSKAYWRKLKQRESQLVTICHGLKLPADDGEMRIEDCANTEGKKW